MTRHIFSLLEAHVDAGVYPAFSAKLRECLRSGMTANAHLFEGRRKLTLSLFPEIKVPGPAWDGLIMHVTFDMAVLNNEAEAKKATYKLDIHLQGRRAAIAYGIWAAEAELLSIQRERDQAARESADQKGAANPENEDESRWLATLRGFRDGFRAGRRNPGKAPPSELLATADKAERQLVLAFPGGESLAGPSCRGENDCEPSE